MLDNAADYIDDVVELKTDVPAAFQRFHRGAQLYALELYLHWLLHWKQLVSDTCVRDVFGTNCARDAECLCLLDSKTIIDPSARRAFDPTFLDFGLSFIYSSTPRVHGAVSRLELHLYIS